MLLENYQTVRLTVGNPNLQQLLLVGEVILIGAVTLRRVPRSELLARVQTDQLRGLAALFVIVGHLWTHVASVRPAIPLSGLGLAMFFVLSGFGLTVSTRDGAPPLGKFAGKRIARVMVPYWITTIVMLLLDGLLLRRTYPWPKIALTMAGVNLGSTTVKIDYVRWFVTFLLVWYAVFYVGRRLQERLGIGLIPMLTGCALAMFALDYYMLDLYWSPVLAFPLGCALGKWRDELRRVYGGHRARLVGTAGILAGCFVVFRLWLDPPLEAVLPTAVHMLAGEAAELSFVLALIACWGVIGSAGLRSGMLGLCGLLSYELILLHAPFLIKYNPIFGFTGGRLVAIGLPLLVVALLLPAEALRRTSAWISGRRSAAAPEAGTTADS